MDMNPTKSLPTAPAKPDGDLYDAIRNGDTVTIETRHGNLLKGRAVMLGPGGWVLNLGGPHGTPGIANRDNVVAVRKRRGASAERVSDLYFSRNAGTKNIRVTLPEGPGFSRDVKVSVTTRGSKADVLLNYSGEEMALFEKGGGKYEELVDGGWVQDFSDLNAALTAFAHKVTW